MFPFRYPDKCRVTCEYNKLGYRWKSGKHDGIDLVSDKDKTVLSVSRGNVIRSGYNASWGQYIVILMKDGRSLIYAHLASRSVKVGDVVSEGLPIGVMGNTGNNTTGAHLHLELQKKYYEKGQTDNIADFLGIKNEAGRVIMTKVELSDREITVNFEGKKLTLDNPAILLANTGRAYFPIRELEKLGFTVQWEGSTYTINIKSNN